MKHSLTSYNLLKIIKLEEKIIKYDVRHVISLF